MPLSRRRFLIAGVGSVGLGVMPSRVLGANDRVNVGLIGVGRQGMRLLSEILPLKDVQIVAVCDLTAEACRMAARTAGKETRVMADYRDLIALAEVDAVIIATPDHTRAEIALAALAAGKDLYLETPMARSLEDSVRLQAAAQATDRIVQISSPLLTHPALQQAVESILDGQIGRVVQISISLRIDPAIGNGPNWRHFREYASPAAAFAPYLDAIHHLMGPDTPIRASMQGGVFLARDDRTNPDTFQAILTYPQGFLVSLSYGPIADSFTVYGSRGSLDLLKLIGIEGGNALLAWLTSLRGRTLPVAGVEVGAQHMAALSLIEQAYRNAL